MNELKNTVLILKGTITLFGNLQKQKKPQNNITPNTQILNTSGTMGKKRQRKCWIICRTYFRSFLSA